MAGEGGSAAAAGLLNGGTGEGPGGKRARLGSAPHSTPAGNRVTVVLGAQWGDEGKGKVVDLLSLDADLVCRCQVSRLLCSWGRGGLQDPFPAVGGTTNPTLPGLKDLAPIPLRLRTYSSHPRELGGGGDYKSHPPQIGGLKSYPL